MAKILMDIDRKGATGLVWYNEDGTVKGARFDLKWTNEQVLAHFKIDKPAAPKKGKSDE